MAYYGAAAQPYEEQPGNEMAKANPDELRAFYEVMQKKDLERKISKRKSNAGTSIWSRKSVKRSAGQATSPSGSQQRPGAVSVETEMDEKAEENRDMATPLMTSPTSRSIIPDALGELPAWFSQNEAAYTMRYQLHNAIGPRRYYNHHLVPPSHRKPASRPPSIFSPSFPPMATSSQDSDDLARLPGPSRTPSNSPLPTPSSSQVGVGDYGKPRSRKTSQTTPDGVDLLDVTDPWGTNWHHQSPYDIGLTNVPVTTEIQENGQRARHTSMTTRETRRRIVTPSPLSQSTSAVHLAPNADVARIPRKLSKRRASTFGLFGNAENRAYSAPSTPLDNAHPSDILDSTLVVPSSAPPSSFKAPSVTTKKERRGSVLGRIAKKFSILKRSNNDKDQAQLDSNITIFRSPSPEKPVQKRVPPPSDDSLTPSPLSTPTHDVDKSLASQPEPEAPHRVSLSSVDQPFSMGRLTIANPDVPSTNNTPQPREIPLPAEPMLLPYIAPHNTPPSIQSSTIHAGTASHVPSSSLQVLSETMKPDVRSAEKAVLPPSPSRSRDISPTKAEPDLRSAEKEMVIPLPPSSRSSREISPTKAELYKRSSAASIVPQTSPRFSQSNGAAFPTAPPAPANGHSQEKRKSRSPEKKPVPPIVPPKAQVFAVVPFPPSEPTQSTPELVPTYLSSMISTYPRSIDNSPLSAASMLANPPTPYTPADLPMPPSSPAPTLPPKEPKRPPREPSPSTVSKQTETFKLVRSISGSVYASTETITAAGQQWEVVEDSKGKNRESKESREFSSKTKSRSKDRDRERDRESSSRRERKEKERAEEHESRKRREKSSTRRSADIPTTSNSISQRSHLRASSVDPASNRAPIPDFVASPRSHKREVSSTRKSTEVPNINKPHPPPPPPTPGPEDSRPLDRNPSKSARPISEVPTAADLNALRGKEAWDMERLFKAQSMYGPSVVASGLAPAPMPAPVVQAFSAEETRATHGSSHTSYTVQNGFHSHPASHIYHSIPPHSQSFPPPTERSANAHPISFANSIPSPALSTDIFLPSRTNPLPEPPRDSSFQPSNLDALLDNDYWTKYYAGVTTAH